MSKINHQRVHPPKQDNHPRYPGTPSACGELSGHYVGAKYVGWGSERQNRRWVAGAKKYVRSRIRFHENQALRDIVRREDD